MLFIMFLSIRYSSTRYSFRAYHLHLSKYQPQILQVGTNYNRKLVLTFFPPRNHQNTILSVRFRSVATGYLNLPLLR